MKREDLEEWLNTKWLGRNLQMMEETDSTNQRAKTAAATGEQEGLVIVAEQQTSGRGRRGRGWISPPGENIYMTMLLRPAFDPGRAPMLTLLAACAAARAAMEPGHESPRIKWPNDLVIGGKKIVGILTEMGMKKSRPDYVIIGVGINCNQTTFSGGLEQKATSLKKEYGHDVCREKVIARFLNEFEELYEGFVQYGSCVCKAGIREASGKPGGTGACAGARTGVDRKGSWDYGHRRTDCGSGRWRDP